VREAKHALDVRPKALKVALPGPVTLARVSRDLHYRDRGLLARAFADALAGEARELAEAGVKVIQLDEPALCRYPDDFDLVAETARVMRIRLDAVNAGSSKKPNPVRAA